MEGFTDIANENDPRKIMNECLRVLWMFAASAADAQKTYQQLLTESESRMMKTNEMVSNLVTTIRELKSTYETQIANVSKSRDEIAQQNSILIKQLTRMEDELERERSLNHDIIQHFFHGRETVQNFKMEQR